MKKPLALILVAFLSAVTCFADNRIYVNGGNMGIGTPTPSAKLEVTGNAIVTGGELDLGGTIFRSTGFGTMTKNYTVYDGTGDYTSSSNSDLQMAGNITIAFEVKFSDGTNLMNFISVGDYSSAPALNDGFRLFRYGGSETTGHGYAFQIKEADDSVTSHYASARGNIGPYNKVVFIYDDSANTAKLYLNDSQVGSTVTSIEIKDPTSDFVIGGWLGQTSNLLDGTMRNVTVYEGVATNPTSWTPSDPNSLTGTGLTVAMYSPNGSGDDNAEGISFTVSGDPVIIGNEPVFTFDEVQGYVGIGTGEPSFELQVIGDISANNVLESSDQRLKRNIKPLLDSLNKLNQFGGRSYQKQMTDAIANSSDAGNVQWQNEIGVIAQEIEAVFPECVKVDKNGVKYVRYTGLIPVLCEAVKELDAKHQIQIDSLEAQNKALEERIRALEARQ